MKFRHNVLLRCLLAAGGCLAGLALPGATYLPISDTDLARGAPVIARASVVATAARLETVAGQSLPFTLVTLELVEAIKGSPGETFVLRLPGGRVDDAVWWVPGTPVFSPGQQVVVLMGRGPGSPGEYRLTELALSKFDLVADAAGRRFAVRTAFSDRDEQAVSKRAPASDGAVEARDAESFLAFLRAVSRRQTPPEIAYASPDTGDAARPKWGNIGGREPGDCGGVPCLFRWFWDTAASPNAVLRVIGTQSNLATDEPKCGTDSTCDAQNAADAWHAVPATDIRLSGPATSGNVTVTFDSTTSSDGTAWTTPLGCEGGIIGLGGPGSGSGPLTFRGDGNYYYPTGGSVSMRKVTCGTGYSARTFRSALLHEVGHVLGLAHPDQVVGLHSITAESDWESAVMHSVIAAGEPDTPQTDDVQAVKYYYGTAALGAFPVPDFSFFFTSSTTAPAGVDFTDLSTNASGWNWDFGDPGSGTDNVSSLQMPGHTFRSPGTYTVTLTAGNFLGGSASVSKTVTVAAGPGLCQPDANTLCVNNNRFQVKVGFQLSDGSVGTGTPVQLTSDSGYFTFFDPKNIEVVVKVLNGCAANQHYWVFTAGLTNVGVTVQVYDTAYLSYQMYTNAVGTAFQPTQDTTAFATCP
jgi:PKD repeat protein